MIRDNLPYIRALWGAYSNTIFLLSGFALILFRIHKLSKLNVAPVAIEESARSQPMPVSTARESKQPSNAIRHLECLLAHSTRVKVVSGFVGRWKEESGSKSVQALSVILRNIGNRSLSYLKARVTYYNSADEFFQQVNSGAWLGATSNSIDLGVGATHALMLAFRLSEQETYASGDNDRISLARAGTPIRAEVSLIAGINEELLQKFVFRLNLDSEFTIDHITEPIEPINTAVLERASAKTARLEREIETLQVRVSAREGQLTTLNTEYGWLHNIAKEQQKNIASYVELEKCSLGDLNLDHPVPSVRFGLYITNRSVFEITAVVEQDSYIVYGGLRLRYPIEVLYNDLVDAPYGRKGCITLMQPLSKEQAEFMLQSAQQTDTNFYFDSVHILIQGGQRFPQIEPQHLVVTKGVNIAGNPLTFRV